jgi:hypothetical protein
MSVFGVLIVDCGLLLELVLLIAETMPPFDSCLQGFVHPYFDTMTPLITDTCYVNEVLMLYCL